MRPVFTADALRFDFRVVGADPECNWIETVVRIAQGNVVCMHMQILISQTQIPVNVCMNPF